MGIAFDAPLRAPAAAAARSRSSSRSTCRRGAGWARADDARRSRSGCCCWPPSSARSPGSSSCCRSTGWRSCSSSTCRTRSGTPGREEALAYLRDSRWRRSRTRTSRGSSRSAADALVERLPSDLAEIDRIASTPVRDATDIGAALRLAGALFPDDAQKRIVLLSDGNDTTGSGQSEAALAAARGIQVETVLTGLAGRDEVLVQRLDGPVDRAPRRVDRGVGRRHLDGRPARDRAAVRQRRAGRHPSPSTSTAGTNRVTFTVHAQGLRVPALPDGRRGRPRHVQPERPRRGEHDRQGRAQGAGRQGRRGRWPRELVDRARDRAPGRGHGHPRGACRRTSPGSPTTTRSCWSTCPRLRLTDAAMAALQVYVRDLGRGLVMVGGPRSVRRRRLHRHAARGDAARRHGRARPREAARRRARRRHRQVGLDGRLPLQQLQRRHGRRVRDRRRAQGRHRQGGDPAGGLGPERARTSSGSSRSTTRRTGSSRRRRWAASRTSSRAIAGINPNGQTNIFAGPRPGGEVARERDRDPAPHHPAHRRLVEQRPVRRDPQADEGRRDHALDGRRGRRREPVPRAARASRAAAASTRRPTRPRSPTSSSRRRSRSPASRSSRSRSSRS